MTRKKFLCNVAVIISVLAPFGLVLGNATTTDTALLLEEAVSDSQTQVTALQINRNTLFEATRGQSSSLTDQERQRITNLAANTSNRLEATINRLQNIIDRTERRIFLTQNAGTDTTSASQALAAAQTSLDTAKLLLKDIDEDVFRFVHSQDPIQNWQIVRDIYVGAESNIQSTVIALRIAFNEITFAIENTNNENN